MTGVSAGKNKQLTPTKLRGLLTASLLILFAGGVALFWFTYTQLQDYGTEVAAKNGEAVASNDSLSTLQATKDFLDSNTALIDQAKLFTLQRDLPQFQIRNDIMHYADLHGLDVDSVELDSSSDGPAAASTSGGSAATPASPTTATDSTATTTAPSNQLSVTVRFADKVDYTAFLKFLYNIEHNLPKMTIEKVHLTEASDDGSVKVEPLLVKTYITQ